MSAAPRFTRLGYASHIIDRTVGGIKAFVDDHDCDEFLMRLYEARLKAEFDVYNYTLIPNHFHLEISLPSDVEKFSDVMQQFLYGYSIYHRNKHGRKGILWQPRFKSHPVKTDAYLLTCGGYIDLNAVRAGLVGEAADYPWSSAGHYLRGTPDCHVTDNPAYLALGFDTATRQLEYGRLLAMWLEHNPGKRAVRKYFRSQPNFYHPTKRLSFKNKTSK